MQLFDGFRSDQKAYNTSVMTLSRLFRWKRITGPLILSEILVGKQRLEIARVHVF